MSEHQSEEHSIEVIGQSIAGPKHKDEGSECQDNWHEVTADDYGIIAVGDGLGSATNSSTGSKIATESATECLSDDLQPVDEPVRSLDKSEVEKLVVDALFQAREAVYTAAEDASQPVEDYHTTLSIALVTGDWYAAVAIGDSGLVGIKEKSEYICLVDREESEHANLTTPLTSDRNFVEDRLRFKYDETSLRAVVGFTDGLDRFVWRQGNKSTPAKEFFDQIYDFITAFDSLEDTTAESELRQFIDSEHFNNYSRDDKTLVIGRLSKQSKSITRDWSSSREYTDQEFVEAVKSDGSTSTKAVQGKVGCSYSTALRRLEELEESQLLESQKTGRRRIWFIDGSND